MNFDYKIFLKCILSGTNYSFISNHLHERKNHGLVLSSSKFYFLALHVRFSSVLYSCQLIDIFAYEIPNLNIIKIHHKMMKPVEFLSSDAKECPPDRSRQKLSKQVPTDYDCSSLNM